MQLQGFPNPTLQLLHKHSQRNDGFDHGTSESSSLNTRGRCTYQRPAQMPQSSSAPANGKERFTATAVWLVDCVQESVEDNGEIQQCEAAEVAAAELKAAI
ncbi:hypothetical protein VaNZ11_017101 [Volvox africanus]|uniref:Uncharacterized protein n=1 Tax=Volvox africanus TaxID=51714 RepID=A0ABQ5SPS2_9CHLO|nr:hypothetical protein VaNZ11_017101 [Volvox africanus]